CMQCPEHRHARWRCKDCTTSPLLCRFCMRHSHLDNPLHRIEYWTGSFFRPAHLWEVGVYVLVQHHLGVMVLPIADSDLVAISGYLDNITISDANHAIQDALNNHYVRVVHVNGVHHIALVTCSCRGAEAIHADLMYCRLVPTTFSRYQTLFTVAVLDDFRISNLECKASAYQYFQKLRRLTYPMAPSRTPNLYQELLRLSRAWRWLKKIKWAGYGHEAVDFNQPTPGELANFCPACPQSGINLPSNWKEDPNAWVYKRLFVADGNFKADHIRQKNKSEVWLSEGGGMMSKTEDYERFLASAVERRTVTPCSNQFRAIELAMLGSKACDVTGVVAVACARHGFFAPNGIANLFRGEQQKNVDWVLLQALKRTNVDPTQGAMLIYDIACQYFVHLQDRIGHLLPEKLSLDRAIGLFHVHGHKEECFFRFATSFIPGAAVTAGEILETLWSSLNAITPTVRTATLANRAETIDDHATDSNHKKMLNIASTLCTRYSQASAMAHTTGQYFENLSSTISVANRAQWEIEIELAESRRLTDPAAMDILRVQKPKQNDESMLPTEGRDYTLVEEWVQMALNVEEKQIELQDHLRRCSSRGHSEKDDKHLRQLSESLNAQFLVLQTLRQRVPGISGEFNQIIEDTEPFSFDDLDEEDLMICELNLYQHSQYSASSPIGQTFSVHSMPLSMPSTSQSPNPLHRAIELILREQQAARLLNSLRETIADKSFQYSHVLRVAPRKTVSSRARSAVVQLNDWISFYCRVYSRCQLAMTRLGANKKILSKFRVLSKKDVKSSTALLDPNKPGSSTLQLSWIWQVESNIDQGSTQALQEFQRVHWLRARAQKQRWKEEVILVGYEMQWTVRFFIHKQEDWERRRTMANDNQATGPAAYAARKAAMWGWMAQDANDSFKRTNSIYITPFL
ncbi:hypothetical protein BGW80DRAFT_1183207, partial [Lactifluus volemus]